MTIQELIELLKQQPPQARIYVWDPENEVAGEIQRVIDIHTPTDNTERYLITDFG